jgi:cysteine synthase A
MSAGNSPARAAMLEGLGAEVILIPQIDGQPGQVTGADVEAAAGAARQIADERGGFYVDQFNAHEGVAAHQETTGPEIIRQIGHRVDAWVASIGTGATFIGVAKALKEVRPQTLCIAVEPRGSRPLAGEIISKPRHLLQGTGYGSVPPHWEPALMDWSIAVSDDEATRWRRELAVREGLYVGFSAAANVCAAVSLLESGRLGDNATVVTILCDTGLKY